MNSDQLKSSNFNWKVEEILFEERRTKTLHTTLLKDEAFPVTP